MADPSMLMPPEPLVMGMTPSDYQAAFSYIDHANFAREVEASEAQQQQLAKRPTLGAPKVLSWYERPEIWALILGVVTFSHAIFAQWVWPLIKARLERDSPYNH